MSESSTERTSDKFDDSTILEIINNSFKSLDQNPEGGVGKGWHQNFSGYSDELFKNIEIIKIK